MCRSPNIVPRLLMGFVCLALAACADDRGDADSSVTSAEMQLEGVGADASGGQSAPAPAVRFRGEPSVGITTMADDAASRQANPPQVLTTGQDSAGRPMIIRTGEARIEVDSLEAGIEAVRRSTVALGGWIAHSSLTLGERERRSARLEVKIPAARWDELLSGLRGIGELRQLTTATEDVGEQFVDLTAQLSNAERLEERYLQLLETRTGSLEDLLAVERELARVRERIEMLQGRLRYLGQRVAVSTLIVDLMEPLDLLSTSPESEPIRDALRAAWQNFLAVITGGIALLGAALPLALLLAAAFWLWRRVRRRGQHVGDS